MRTSIFSILLLLIGFSSSAQTPRKHALIIAIGNYEPHTGWDSISSLNDIPLVTSALEAQGFKDTVVLRDSEATREGIIQALRDLAERVDTGDVVVVHFSSHGQQIQDQKTYPDKDETDNLDEAIVAWGAPIARKKDPNYKGEQHLRDEHLGQELNRIRKALGEKGDLLLLVDACHSGTATRGPLAQEKSRGTNEAFIFDDDFERGTDNGDEVDVFESSSAVSRGADEEGPMSPMVVISAALAHERNFEFEGAGSLSVAFSRAMKKVDTVMTYRTLYNNMLKEMSVIAENQHPAVEGDIDRELFGGKVVPQQPYYKVRYLDGTSISLIGGAINGLNEGTTFKVFKANSTSDTVGRPLATGEIKSAGITLARGELDSNVVLPGAPEDYWVFIDKMALRSVTVRVSLSKLDDPILKRRAAQVLGELPVGEVSDSAVDFFLQRDPKAQLQLVFASNGEVFRDGLSTEGQLEAVSDAVLRFAQGRYLKDLEFNNAQYKVELEVLPVKEVNGELLVDSVRLSQVRKNGNTTFSIGDQVAIRIINRGSKKMFYNIIYITETGEPFAFIPDVDESPDGFWLEKGADVLLTDYIIDVEPPAGIETLKVFTSSKEIDLTAIAGRHRGPSSDSVVETLFGESQQMSTRGLKAKPFSSKTKAGSFTLVFEVVE